MRKVTEQWPFAARAQQLAKLPTIGFVESDTPDLYATGCARSAWWSILSLSARAADHSLLM